MRSALSRRATLAVAIVLALGVGWWAGRATLVESQERPSAAVPAVSVEVVTASVGQVLTLSAVAVQPFEQVATNALTGIVTAVGDGQAEIGGVLYEVDGVPVRAVVGDTPFHRDLGQGLAGPDVLQLQEALVALGFLDAEVDGRYGASTSEAVRNWQRDVGRRATGSIPLGEVLAMPSLPDAVRLGESITLGSVLSGGEQAVAARRADPTFEIVVNAEQGALAPVGTRVTLSLGDLTWPAVVGRAGIDDSAQVALALAAPDGAIVCGDECHLLPPVERTLLTAAVEVVPQVTGPAVPAAAVLTDASGAAFVRTADGTAIPVEVVASGQGLVVIDGIDVGERVLVRGGEES